LLVELFSSKCALGVAEAEDKRAIDRGTIWFAPPGYHLLIESDRSFSLSLDEPVNYSRPSIDVLFESAAEVYRDKLLALILTGANQDGARGAAAIQRAGGLLGVQDPATAQASMMPAICIERTTPDVVGTLDELAAFTMRHASGART
jgi:two-component system chemotaxis response regulator CheB